ncbi:unnamed protein product [Pleuronectes platessa]|uniref:Uncharacterized protein n=1 Tax=Pleuronectes platessa TaxID=8262 RepID=A0A9N7VM81_PLEPL|nr:unnamed protein product [Pleuronectes platessa]
MVTGVGERLRQQGMGGVGAGVCLGMAWKPPADVCAHRPVQRENQSWAIPLQDGWKRRWKELHSFLQQQQQPCRYCPMSTVVASDPSLSCLPLLFFPLMVTLDTPLGIRKDVKGPVGTIKDVLRKPLRLSRKQPSPPFSFSAIYCLLSRREKLISTLHFAHAPDGDVTGSQQVISLSICSDMA